MIPFLLRVKPMTLGGVENSMSRQQDEPNTVITKLMAERHQNQETRRPLFEAIEKELKRPVVSFFTSFTQPVSLDDNDVDMLLALLNMLDLSNGLALLINTPGGDGVAAERIINVCRSYSGTGEYQAIVPGKAKSAGTMVCFGASEIMMGPTSELGPVDPQVIIQDNNGYRYIAAHHVIKSYEDLFNEGVNASGNLEPYIQQLSRYDARIIEEYRTMTDLADDISVRALKSGMMVKEDEDDIREKIKVFLSPEETKTHGRPVYKEEAEKCGLHIRKLRTNSKLWKLVYELYLRTDYYTRSYVLKCVESKDDSFTVS